MPWGVRLALGLAFPIAVGLSYSRNKSVPWAILHGFIAIPYLAYYVATEKK
jgi:hypothetical protein